MPGKQLETRARETERAKRERREDKEREIASEAAVHPGGQHQKNILTKHNLCCANFVEVERREEQRVKKGRKGEGSRGRM